MEWLVSHVCVPAAPVWTHTMDQFSYCSPFPGQFSGLDGGWYWDGESEDGPGRDTQLTDVSRRR